MVCPVSNEVTATLSTPNVYGVPTVAMSTLIPPLVNGDESLVLISKVPSKYALIFVPWNVSVTVCEFVPTDGKLTCWITEYLRGISLPNLELDQF